MSVISMVSSVHGSAQPTVTKITLIAQGTCKETNDTRRYCFVNSVFADSEWKCEAHSVVLSHTCDLWSYAAPACSKHSTMLL